MTAPLPPSGTFGRPVELEDVPGFVREMVTDMHRDKSDDWRSREDWIVVRCWRDHHFYTLTAARIYIESNGNQP